MKNLGKTEADDEPLPFSVILECNGLDYALWCCRAEPQYAREWRLYAVWCARQVQHLMADQRSVDALHVAERYANGNATNDELASAYLLAREAANNSARDAAWSTTRPVAAEAAWAAAMDSACAAKMNLVGADKRIAAQDAAVIMQSQEFLRLVMEAN